MLFSVEHVLRSVRAWLFINWFTSHPSIWPCEWGFKQQKRTVEPSGSKSGATNFQLEIVFTACFPSVFLKEIVNFGKWFRPLLGSNPIGHDSDIKSTNVRSDRGQGNSVLKTLSQKELFGLTLSSVLLNPTSGSINWIDPFHSHRTLRTWSKKVFIRSRR